MSAPAWTWLAAARASSFKRGIVQNPGAGLVAAHDAAMAVLHVFAQADIGDDEQLGQLLLQQPHGLLDDAVGGVGAGGFGVFAVGNAEQQHGRHAQLVRAGRLAQQFIRRKLEHAGHGGDGPAQLAARADEQRQDQLGDVQLRLPHQLRARPATGANAGADRRGTVPQDTSSWLVFYVRGGNFKVQSAGRTRRENACRPSRPTGIASLFVKASVPTRRPSVRRDAQARGGQTLGGRKGCTPEPGACFTWLIFTGCGMSVRLMHVSCWMLSLRLGMVAWITCERICISINAGRPRLRTPVGDFGKASNLLQQLQHSDFGSHKCVLERVPAGHVPSGS